MLTINANCYNRINSIAVAGNFFLLRNVIIFFSSQLISPDCVVHGPEGKERQRVEPHHDDDKEHVQDDADKADDQFGVEQEDGLVLPRTVQAQLHRVQHVLDGRIDDQRQQDGVLKAKDQLHGGALGQGGVVGVRDHHVVHEAEHAQQANGARVKQPPDDRTAFHLERNANQFIM